MLASAWQPVYGCVAKVGNSWICEATNKSVNASRYLGHFPVWREKDVLLPPSNSENPKGTTVGWGEAMKCELTAGEVHVLLDVEWSWQVQGSEAD